MRRSRSDSKVWRVRIKEPAAVAAADDEPPGLPLERTWNTIAPGIPREPDRAAAVAAADDWDDDGRSEASSSNTTVAGDVIADWSEEAAPGGSDVQPKEKFIEIDRAAAVAAASTREQRGDAGNVGYIFVNNGLLAKDQGIRQNFDTTLKKNPAQILGMAECQAETEELLRSRGEAGDKSAEKGSMEYRDSYEYLTLRGDEDVSNLLAVRKQVAESLELLHFEKISRNIQEEANPQKEA